MNRSRDPIPTFSLLQMVLAVLAHEDGSLRVAGLVLAAMGFGCGFRIDEGSWAVAVMVALVLEMVRSEKWACHL